MGVDACRPLKRIVVRCSTRTSSDVVVDLIAIGYEGNKYRNPGNREWSISVQLECMDDSKNNTMKVHALEPFLPKSVQLKTLFSSCHSVF